MLLRPVEAEFAPRAQVFPGGRIDEADADDEWRDLVEIDPLVVGASGSAADMARYVIGALREVFEETRVMLGVGPDEFPGEEWASEQRRRLAADEVGFAEVVRDAGLHLKLAPMVFFANWITPEGLPKRYDTRFFATRMPEGQEAVAAPGEIQSLEWISPPAALARADTNDAYTLPPTRAVLSFMANYGSVEDAISGLARDRDLTPVLPRIVNMPEDPASGMGGIQVLMPGDPGYE